MCSVDSGVFILVVAVLWFLHAGSGSGASGHSGMIGERPVLSLPHIQTSLVNEQPVEQIGGTCYAHAVATLIRQSQARVAGRVRENHTALVDEIVKQFGSKGADPFAVMTSFLPPRRLHFEQVDIKNVDGILRRNRPVLMAFFLDGWQWHAFGRFYHENPDGVLNTDDLPHSHTSRHWSRWWAAPHTDGHAVVVVGGTESVWKVKNSWGPTWAGNGYFEFERGESLHEKFAPMRFFDIFFYEKDLTPDERTAYQRANEL